LLRFKVSPLLLRGKHYLILPKLNSMQVELLTKRFAEMGSVKRGLFLAVSTRRGTIRVSEAGLCWSSFDPSDTVLPVVPDLLSCPKEEVPIETVRGKYLRMQGFRSRMAIRILPRLEFSSLWRELRASGGCALAPDEHAVVSSLLRATGGTCRMVTDFFVDGSTPLVCGRKRYFESKLDSGEAALTLGLVGKPSRRNSYIPMDGELGSIPLSLFSRTDWVDLFHDLGEWCPFTPV